MTQFCLIYVEPLPSMISFMCEMHCATCADFMLASAPLYRLSAPDPALLQCLKVRAAAAKGKVVQELQV